MKIELALAMAALVAPLAGAQNSGKPVEKVVQTTLDDIRQHPDAYKSVWVQFPVQFCSIGRVSNPFFTQFVPSQFANFYAWSAEQPIWREKEYDDVFGTLFISKENEQLNDIYDLGLYQRINVTGVVRNVFQSKPWIEVISFEPMPGAVDTPTLAHMFRGESHMQRRQWNRAISELSLASAGDVPQTVLSKVHEDLAVCYLRLGESDQAVMHLEEAKRMQTTSSTEFDELYRTAKNSPELQLDRQVEAVEVGDHERPMWEAFEDASAVSAGS